MPLSFPMHSSRQQLVRATLDLLFPPICAFCQGELASQQLPPALCCTCRQSLSTPVDQLCGRCGRRRRSAPTLTATPTSATSTSATSTSATSTSATSTSATSTSATAAGTPLEACPVRCPGCRNEGNVFERVICLGPHGSQLREAIVRMKHGGQQSLTAAVGGFLGERACQQWQQDPPELLIPLPMHWKRRLLRGPGSSLILAESIANQTGVAVHRGLLFCTRATKKQSTLSPLQRRNNVKGAFGLSKAGLPYCRSQHLCLVDDTLTTGATVNEAAQVLRRAGARSVSVVVAARAVEHG